MSAQDNKTLVRRFFDEMCNGRKLNLADQLFTATHAYHDPNAPTGPGPQGMRDVIATYQNAFEGAHWDVKELIAAENDYVTAIWSGSGTHTGELNGIPPTGKKAMVPGIWLFKIANGKIVESWNNWDTLGLMQQIGVVPTMAPAKK